MEPGPTPVTFSESRAWKEFSGASASPRARFAPWTPWNRRQLFHEAQGGRLHFAIGGLFMQGPTDSRTLGQTSRLSGCVRRLLGSDRCRLA
jgi:hypothetical protein